MKPWEPATHEVKDLGHQRLARVLVVTGTAVVAGEDRVLRMRHGGDLRCFGRAIPWCLDQTLAAGGHRK